MSSNSTRMEFSVPDLALTLTVRDMTVAERVNRPFVADLLVRAPEGLAASDLVGVSGVLTLHLEASPGPARDAAWRGWVVAVNDVGGDDAGHRLLAVQLSSKLWAMGQNRNYRVFQQIDEVSIACALLDEWGIPWELELDPARFPKRKYRVQYAESDLTFLTRNLEEVGVTFILIDDDGEEKVVLRDEPQREEPSSVLRTVGDVSNELGFLWATGAQIVKRARPGRYVVADLDWRLPADRPLRTAAHRQDASSLEQSLERYHYVPGFSLVASSNAETPVADDKGAARTNDRFADQVARLRLEAKQSAAERVRFETNDLGVHPGVVVSLVEHRRKELEAPFFVVATILSGTDHGTWRLQCEGAPATLAYRPPLETERPRVPGLESATVVGPAGEEVHTDEFGRVRVQFHWDREGRRDDGSSCWVPVSQPWAGANYGASYLPRVGQEVLVEFLGGDPDRPVITGRMYTNLQRTPYKLPDEKTVTVIAKTSSFGGGGGFNEIKADDRQGGELLYVQAERDLETLVKREERRTVGVDRLTTIGRSEVLEVARDRNVTIGSVQTKTFTSPRPDAPRTVQTDTNGHTKLEVGTSIVEVTPGKIFLTTGAGASITLEGSSITLDATTINIKATGMCDVKGEPINLNC